MCSITLDALLLSLLDMCPMNSVILLVVFFYINVLVIVFIVCQCTYYSIAKIIKCF